MTILHIDASISGENSASRAITRSIVDRVKGIGDGDTIIYRDLAKDPLPHLTFEAFADSAVLEEFLSILREEIHAIAARRVRSSAAYAER